MGWAEKKNVRSDWYKKRHPVKPLYDIDHIEVMQSNQGELKPRSNILSRLLKNFSQKGASK